MSADRDHGGPAVKESAMHSLVSRRTIALPAALVLLVAACGDDDDAGAPWILENCGIDFDG